MAAIVLQMILEKKLASFTAIQTLGTDVKRSEEMNNAINNPYSQRFYFRHDIWNCQRSDCAYCWSQEPKGRRVHLIGRMPLT